ncbi:hypothetical protein KUCAC02_037614, partial [Chaenocephalus aceratus]
DGRRSSTVTKVFIVDPADPNRKSSEEDFLLSALQRPPQGASAGSPPSPPGPRFLIGRLGSPNRQQKPGPQPRPPAESSGGLSSTETSRIQRETDFLRCAQCLTLRPSDPFSRFCAQCGAALPGLPAQRLPPAEGGQSVVCGVGAVERVPPPNASYCPACSTFLQAPPPRTSRSDITTPVGGAKAKQTSAPTSHDATVQATPCKGPAPRKKMAPPTAECSTQTVGLYYPSATELQRKEQQREKCSKTNAERQPASAVSPGRGFWRQQVDHVSSHLRSYAQNNASFRTLLGEPRLGRVTSAHLCHTCATPVPHLCNTCTPQGGCFFYLLCYTLTCMSSSPLSSHLSFSHLSSSHLSSSLLSFSHLSSSHLSSSHLSSSLLSFSHLSSLSPVLLSPVLLSHVLLSHVLLSPLTCLLSPVLLSPLTCPHLSSHLSSSLLSSSLLSPVLLSPVLLSPLTCPHLSSHLSSSLLSSSLLSPVLISPLTCPPLSCPPLSSHLSFSHLSSSLLSPVLLSPVLLSPLPVLISLSSSLLSSSLLSPLTVLTPSPVLLSPVLLSPLTCPLSPVLLSSHLSSSLLSPVLLSHLSSSPSHLSFSHLSSSLLSSSLSSHLSFSHLSSSPPLTCPHLSSHLSFSTCPPLSSHLSFSLLSSLSSHLSSSLSHLSSSLLSSSLLSPVLLSPVLISPLTCPSLTCPHLSSHLSFSHLSSSLLSSVLLSPVLLSSHLSFSHLSFSLLSPVLLSPVLISPLTCPPLTCPHLSSHLSSSHLSSSLLSPVLLRLVSAVIQEDHMRLLVSQVRPAAGGDALSGVTEASAHRGLTKPPKLSLTARPPVLDVQLLKELGPGGGQVSAVQQLLDQGADPSCCHGDGRHALTVAVVKRSPRRTSCFGAKRRRRGPAVRTDEDHGSA